MKNFILLVLLLSFSLFAMDGPKKKKKKRLRKISAACTTINAHTDKINAISCSQIESKLVSCSRHGGIKIWDLKTQKCTQELAPDVDACSVGVCDVAFHPDGKTIASGDLRGKLKLWDISSGKEVSCLEEKGSVSALSYNQDGNTLAFGISSRNSVLKLIDLKNNKCKKSYKTDDWGVKQIKVTKELIIAGLAHRGLVFWNQESGEVTKLGWRGSHYSPWELQHGPQFVFTSNAQLAIKYDLRNVFLYDHKKGGKPILKNKGDAFVYALACSPDEKTIAISRSEFGKEFITLWDIEKDTTVCFDNGGSVNKMEYSPDGSFLITGLYDGKIKLWNLKKVCEKSRSGKQ